VIFTGAPYKKCVGDTMKYILEVKLEDKSFRFYEFQNKKLLQDAVDSMEAAGIDFEWSFSEETDE